jgi:regulatory protein
MLEKRARSRSELVIALRRGGVPVDVSTTVIERFTDLGLINDAALAEEFARARHTGRSQAAPAIAAQLRRRGIDDSVIRQAVSDLDPAGDSSAALALARSRLPRLTGLDTRTRIRRLTGLLARRGYSAEVVARAVREALESDDESQDLAVLTELE